MSKISYESLNIKKAVRQLDAAFAANQTILFVGPPGVGKTAIAHEVARHRGVKCLTLLGSTLDPTDVGGFPVVDPKSGQFLRVPMAIIRQAANEGVLLVLDELSCCSKAVEATLLRLIHDRVAGDVTLHPDTRILCLANPPDQAPGGFDYSPPLVGRLQIFEFRPDFDEITDHFNNTLGEGNVEEPTPFGALCRDWAATAAHKPDLIQIDPPQAAFEGAPWAAPRAWERALRCMAALGDATHEEQFTALAGSVGAHHAQAYLAIRKLRVHLPTVEEIVAAPADAKLPAKVEYQIGALGLLQEVARKDVWAAWIYASRCTEEIGQAAARGLGGRNVAKKSAHAKAGVAARNQMMGRIGSVVMSA